MKQILITGANGQLGSELRNVLSQQTDFQFIETDVDTLDLTNKAATENTAPEPLQLLLIPVQVSYSLTQSSDYSTSYVDYVTSNYLTPAAIALKKAPGELKIRVVASDLK